MYINQQDAQISLIKLYFSLDALHVSDFLVRHQERRFINCISQLVYADTSGCCVAIATLQPDGLIKVRNM